MYLLCIKCVEAVIQSILSFCFFFLSVPLLVQSNTADDKVESLTNEAGNQEAQKEQEGDKLEEGQGEFLNISAASEEFYSTRMILWMFVTSESSLGSVGSSEQLPDSDSEQEDSSQQAPPSHGTAMELSEVSLDDDLDLSSQSTADPEQDQEADSINLQDVEPPTLPNTEPPDEETEEQLSRSVAELNVNQSNSNLPRSPILRDLSGVQLVPLCSKKLPLSRNRLSQPDFV